MQGSRAIVRIVRREQRFYAVDPGSSDIVDGTGMFAVRGTSFGTARRDLPRPDPPARPGTSQAGGPRALTRLSSGDRGGFPGLPSTLNLLIMEHPDTQRFCQTLKKQSATYFKIGCTFAFNLLSNLSCSMFNVNS